MAMILIGFIVAVFCAVVAFVLGFPWWQVLAIYVGSGSIGLTVAAIAWGTAPDDARKVEIYEDGEPDPRAVIASTRTGNMREWK